MISCDRKGQEDPTDLSYFGPGLCLSLMTPFVDMRGFKMFGRVPKCLIFPRHLLIKRDLTGSKSIQNASM